MSFRKAAEVCMDVVRDKCVSSHGSDYFIPEFERLIREALSHAPEATERVPEVPCYGCGHLIPYHDDNLCRGCGHHVCVPCCQKYEHEGEDGQHGTGRAPEATEEVPDDMALKAMADEYAARAVPSHLSAMAGVHYYEGLKAGIVIAPKERP